VAGGGDPVQGSISDRGGITATEEHPARPGVLHRRVPDDAVLVGIIRLDPYKILNNS
jgi:hypothetical protein